jgi:hypothetical protein
MENRDERQLEELIHRELRKLPEVPAPVTLVHRVMLEVHARAHQAWWKRSWLAWPMPMQACSLLVLLASAGLVSYLTGAAWDGLSVNSIPSRAAEWLSTYAPIWQTAKTFLNACFVVLKQVGAPLLAFVAGGLLLVYLACVGVGTVCFRVAFNRN